MRAIAWVQQRRKLQRSVVPKLNRTCLERLNGCIKKPSFRFKANLINCIIWRQSVILSNCTQPCPAKFAVSVYRGRASLKAARPKPTIRTTSSTSIACELDANRPKLRVMAGLIVRLRLIDAFPIAFRCLVFAYLGRQYLKKNFSLEFINKSRNF